MRTFVPRAALAAALMATVAGCASGGGAGVALGSDTGGRYLVMIPAFSGPSGSQVAGELRGLVMGMATHVALNDGEVRRTMNEYDVEELNEIAALQLASLIGAQLVFWGDVTQVGTGFEANVKVMDSRSGDQITLDAVAGTTVPELAANIFDDFGRAVEGIAQAGYCNDYLSSNNFEQAIQNCDAALAIVPTSSTALYGRATALLQLDRNEEALRAYQVLLELVPGHSDALLGAGLAASRLSQSQQAMGFYRRYLEINPGSADVRMTVANDIAQTGDYVSAYQVLALGARELVENTDFQTYFFQMAAAAGRALREQGDSSAAQGALTAAYEAYQRGYADATEVNVAVLQRVIEVLSALRRSDDAIRIARDATTRFADNGQLWSTYATALREAGRDEEEIQALTRLLAVDPTHETALVRRAQAYVRSGQRQLALTDLERFAQSDPQTAASVLYNVGAQSAQTQNWDDAASVLEMAHRHGNAEVRSNSAYLWGVSILQQAAAIARTNQGNVQQFERTISLTNRSVQLLQSSTNPAAAQYVPQAQQLLANQQALLQSLRR